MTITYPDGMTLEALLLSRSSGTLSASVQGEDDTRIFTLMGGAWISEEGEPVRVEYAWERSAHADSPAEAECVCSRELAARLISMLVVGTDGDQVLEDMLWVFSAEGQRVRINQSQLLRLPAELAPGAMDSTLVN